MDLSQFTSLAHWTTPPVSAAVGDGLVVEARAGSDAWRTTSYGFIHDDAHALLVEFADQSSVEVDFVLDYSEQFDQAGLMLRVDAEHWIKAGVEISDGAPQVGAVVTRQVSDWSVAPVPDWVGQQVTIRASRVGDAVTIRAKAAAAPWQLVRVAPIDPAADIEAGPYCASPTRGGLRVRFTGIRFGAPDASLHPSD